MLRSPFRLLVRGPYPGRARRKPAAAALLAALALAGCGGGQRAPADAVRTVAGRGFAFAAPAAWRVERTVRGVEVAPAGERATLLRVERYRLSKPYRAALFARAAAELDRTEERLARRLRARIERRTVVRVAGRRARRYELSYARGGRDLVQRTAYLLVGRTEYVLACRFPADAGEAAPAACDRMLRTFSLR